MTQIAEHAAERTLAQAYAQLYPAEVAAELRELMSYPADCGHGRRGFPRLLRAGDPALPLVWHLYVKGRAGEL